MPLYKFDCSNCGEFEELIGINEELDECPTCGNEVKKIFTTCSVHYNALGFTKNENYGGRG